MLDHSTLPLFSPQPPTKEIPLNHGKVAIVDESDYEWLMQWKWFAVASHKTWYAQRYDFSPERKRLAIRMHRVVIDAPPHLNVDHVDHDGLNNTRLNLRLATSSQNGFNKEKPVTNTSGYKGVALIKQSSRWRAYIRVDQKLRHLGTFASAEDAARAYDIAAYELGGAFARLNFP